MKCVVPFSGGLDSTVLVHYALHNGLTPYALTFSYGQKHSKEIEFATNTCKKLNISQEILDISFLQKLTTSSALTNSKIPIAQTKDVMGDPQTVNYVPFRNQILLSIASAYAENIEANIVYHGAAEADSVAGFWDGSADFFKELNILQFLNRRHKIEVQTPLIDKSKEQIVKLGQQLGVNFTETWTCYEGKETACGRCTACGLRIKGFIDAGIIDPIKYSVNIPWTDLFKSRGQVG